MISNLKHLEILKNYQFKYDEIKKQNDQALRTWLDEIKNYFESAVFDDEVGNTEVIGQMDRFVQEYKKLEATGELDNKFTYLVDQAKNIIDEAIGGQIMNNPEQEANPFSDANS